MSGPMRQQLGPTKARIIGYINEFPKDVPEVDPTKPREENDRRLHDTQVSLRFEQSKLKSAVELIKENIEKWADLLQKLTGDALTKEEELYRKVAEGPEGIVETMLQAYEKIAQLETMMFECDKLAKVATSPPSSPRHATFPEAPAGQSAANIATSTANANVHYGTNIRLPKIQLPSFYGDCLRWREFWDVFETSVHLQPISSVQKFNYLKGVLKGAAADTVAGIAVNNENYSEAIGTLQRRFGDAEVIRDSLYAQLRNMTVTSTKVGDLRQTIDSFERILRQLRALGEQTDHPSLVRLMLEKLPYGILTELERLKKPSENWSVESLRTCLWDLILMKERVNRISGNCHLNASATTGGDNKIKHSMSQQPKKLQYPHSTADALSLQIRSKDKQQKPPDSGTTSQAQPPTQPCVFCKGRHFSDACSVYKSLEARRNSLMNSQRCFKCLIQGHRSRQCRRPKKRCFHCKEFVNHHQSLCPTLFQEERPSSPQKARQRMTAAPVTDGDDASNPEYDAEVAADEEPNEVINSTVGLDNNTNDVRTENQSVLLLTAEAMIAHPDDPSQTTKARLFFDPGSQRTFIIDTKTDQLHLPTVTKEALALHTFACRKSQCMPSKVVNFKIRLKDGSTLLVTANSLPYLMNDLTKTPIGAYDLKFLEAYKLADTMPSKSSKFRPDILIGLDYFFDLVDTQANIQLPSGGLHLLASKLGYLLGGRFSTQYEESKASSYAVAVRTELNQGISELNQHIKADRSMIQTPSLEDFWKLESIGISDSVELCDDDYALQMFNETVEFNDKRYYVQWPWKDVKAELPDNFGLAFGRFKSLARRLQKDPDLLQKYDAIIQDQLKKQIIEKVVDRISTGTKKHYLAHQPVITPQKATTKVRIVYDASAKERRDALSLNECMYRGPVILPDLCGLLLRFRLSSIAMVADVEKAFLQLCLQPQERDVTRFLWFKDPSNPVIENNLEIFRFRRVTFGVIASPFLLAATIKYHLKKADTPVAHQIAENAYVDNMIMSANTVDEAKCIYTEAKELFQAASMNLREWTSNSKEFRDSLPVSDKAGTSIKVLGIQWNVESDQLQLSAYKKVAKEDHTKRSVLQSVASVYDPLGLLAPITLQGKLFLQALWKANLQWDDLLTQELADEWRKLMAQYEELGSVTTPRRAFEADEHTQKYELLIFVDASKSAYAAAAYLRVSDEVCAKTTSSLIFVKNRVAPMKEVSIPRLELLAMVIGVRMASFLKSQLSIHIDDTIVFSDSECCLQWLKTTKPLSVFVQNRIREILKKSSEISFRYISTSENPADMATKSLLSTDELKSNELWWHGPGWVTKPKAEWPVWNLPELMPETLAELKKVRAGSSKSFYEASMVSYTAHTCIAESTEPGAMTLAIDERKHSSLQKLLRVSVYCLKYLKIKLWSKLSEETKKKFVMQDKILEDITCNGLIVAKEMHAAQYMWDYATQRLNYADVVTAINKGKDHILKNQLGVRLDIHGLLRCHGRIVNAELPVESLLPKLLPRQSYYTQLVIEAAHREKMHAGVQHTLADIRQQYWLPKGRAVVKSVIGKCMLCKKHKGAPFELPPLAVLPRERVVRSRPFQYVGLDYAGPLFLKKGAEKVKVWICVFTCFVVRAIHLELAMGLSAEQFINCFRRFVARRGMPERVISDNASHSI